jgi:hypothetical protein
MPRRSGGGRSRPHASRGYCELFGATPRAFLHRCRELIAVLLSFFSGSFDCGLRRGFPCGCGGYLVGVA